MTFQEPEVEPDTEEGRESYPLELSIIDVDTWLDWWVGLPTGYFMLVDGTYSHPRGRRLTKTHLEDLGLLLDSRGQQQGLP